eukprot:TRINITY_DN224_c0_g1_i2.p1 TRINITY_DN224_c0_g1~~TRINITY_DN224_c0_g1_i2.p1  ORF type:complete len:266 (+),score=37.28 TRINITY_DN224_c0_g1_i2:105-902(+)
MGNQFLVTELLGTSKIGFFMQRSSLSSVIFKSSLLAANSVTELAFTILILVRAVEYLHVRDHPMCDDLKSVLGSSENQQRFFGLWSHIVIAVISVIYNIFRLVSLLSFVINTSSGNEPSSEGYAYKLSISMPSGCFFNTWFLAVSYDDKCLGLNLTGGDFIVTFSNDYYNIIFCIILGFLLFFCCCFLCLYFAMIPLFIQGTVFAVVYAIYSKNIYIQVIMIASLVVAILNVFALIKYEADTSSLPPPNFHDRNEIGEEHQRLQP